MNRILFRGAVAASVVLYVAWYFLPYDSFLDDPAAVNLLRLDGYGAFFSPQHWFFTHGVLLLWLVASAGLWHFDSWARHLYLLLTVWSLVTAGLFGIRVSSPLEGVLGLILDLLAGFILAMAYFSSAKEFFAIKETSNAAVQEPPTNSPHQNR